MDQLNQLLPMLRKAGHGGTLVMMQALAIYQVRTLKLAGIE